MNIGNINKYIYLNLNQGILPVSKWRDSFKKWKFIDFTIEINKDELINYVDENSLLTNQAVENFLQNSQKVKKCVIFNGSLEDMNNILKNPSINLTKTNLLSFIKKLHYLNYSEQALLYILSKGASSLLFENINELSKTFEYNHKSLNFFANEYLLSNHLKYLEENIEYYHQFDFFRPFRNQNFNIPTFDNPIIETSSYEELNDSSKLSFNELLNLFENDEYSHLFKFKQVQDKITLYIDNGYLNKNGNSFYGNTKEDCINQMFEDFNNKVIKFDKYILSASPQLFYFNFNNIEMNERLKNQMILLSQNKKVI